MIDLNKVLIVGRLTRKPELRYLPSGMALAELDIAYNRRYRSKVDNEMKDEAHFFRAKTFGKSAEFAGEYFDKGKAIFIEGRLVLEKWEAKDGTSREKVVILADRVGFAESRASEGGGHGGGPNYADDQDSGGGGSSSAPRGAGRSGSGSSAPASQPQGGDEPAGGHTENDLPF